MGGLLQAFPLILLSVIIYAVLVGFYAVTGSAAEGLSAAEQMNQFLAQGIPIPLVSGDTWVLGISDALLAFSLILLFQEVLRATESSGTSIFNHALSMIVFILCIVLFLVVEGFGTSTFFLIMLMSLFDVVAGFTVSIVSARRDFGGGGVPIIGNGN